MAYADGEGAPDKRETVKPPLDECGMARAARLLGDKWTMLIVREALYGVTRYDAMQADLGIPRTVLADRLKMLCDSDILTKRDYRDPGQRTRSQYVLTTKGVDLAVPLIALMQWGDKHFANKDPAVHIVDRDDGKPCVVGFVNANGEPISIGDVQLARTA